MTSKQINAALRPLGLEIQHKRGDGYSYFTSRRFGHQIGESVFACYLSAFTVPQWVELAKWAIKQHRREGTPFAGSQRRFEKRNQRFTLKIQQRNH